VDWTLTGLFLISYWTGVCQLVSVLLDVAFQSEPENEFERGKVTTVEHLPPSLFFPSLAMDASPVPVDRGDTQVREKWSGKEDRAGDSLAHGADLPPSNGGPPDERGASDTVNAEYHSRSPGGGDPGTGSRSSGTTIYREKQVKVLRSSHVLRFVPATYAFLHGQRA
jgi:hypothetical protein